MDSEIFLSALWPLPLFPEILGKDVQHLKFIFLFGSGLALFTFLASSLRAKQSLYLVVFTLPKFSESQGQPGGRWVETANILFPFL